MTCINNRRPLSDPSLAPAAVARLDRRKSPRPLRWSGPGDVRVGPVLAIPAVLADFGIRPQSAFVRAGVDARLFDDPDQRIALEALGRLFEACVALTGCAHFGLLVGERFDLAAFGPLGALLRNAPTVGDAVRSLVLNLCLHDRGAAPVLLVREASCVALGYSIYRHGTPAGAQIHDAAIAIGYRMLAELCGPAWQAQHVQFSHGRPRSAAPYRRVFGTGVVFDAEVSAVVFSASWLSQRIEGADAALHGRVAQAIRDAQATGPMSFGAHVQAVLHQMLLSGAATAEAVAHLFAIHERTLRRRLADEGMALQQLINQTRFELAQQLLQNTGLPVAEIAAALQYTDPNAFSRAFRSWANLSPSQWRSAVTRE
jgi:AraC-like DNA-binding protein